MTGGEKKSRLVRTPFLMLFAVCQFALSYACTPAVIWCPHNESSDYDATYRTAPSSPLQKLTSEEFERSLSQFNTTESAIVADELCVEDLRNSKVLSNATNGSKIFYFPCVVTPDAIFRKIYKQVKTIEDINDDHEFNMILKDVDSSGCTALTGKQCRYNYVERIKRDTANDNSTEFKIRTEKILFYSGKSLLFKAPGENSKEVTLTQSKVSEATSRTDKDKKAVILTIKFIDVDDIGSLTLEFFFNKNGSYYTWSQINYEAGNIILRSKRDISFPKNFSYHCFPKTVFANGNAYLNITDMQVQVDSKNGTFSDAYDCVGFTSIPIWTGIFVTTILGLIMIWALTMIMDIRTMDRFDDPKGKTITISAAE
ncbi:hypothetical protein P5V15_005451 [Pogonomyrmex californicus]